LAPLAGDGAIDLEGVIRTMARLDYAGHVSLELYPYVNAPEIAGEKSLAHLAPLFAKTGLTL
jgi:sugar phosphate isomerase/epimerase